MRLPNAPAAPGDETHGLSRTGIVLSGILIIVFLLLLIHHTGSVVAGEAGVPSVSMKLYAFPSNTRLSALELTQRDSRFQPLEAEAIDTGNTFLYVWITLKNSGSRDREIFLYNITRNYYTELLKPDPKGALQLYRHGDIVPASQYAVRHHRTAFPLVIPAGETVEYVIEYRGPKGLRSDLRITDPQTYVDLAARERIIVGIISGFFMALILFNLFSGIIEHNRTILTVAAFTLSVFITFLRQSRILLLIIAPATYPEWLYPLTLCSNLVWGGLLGIRVLRPHLRRYQAITIRVVFAGTACATLLSLFVYPYLMADMLNLMALVLLAVFAISVVKGIRARDVQAIWLSLSFTPWIMTVLLDILVGWIGVRTTGMIEYAQILGLLAHLIILTVYMQISRIETRERLIRRTQEELRRLRSERGVSLKSLGQIRTAVIHKVTHELREPLDALIATVAMLLQESAEPRMAVALSIVMEEARRLKMMIGESAAPQDESGQIEPQPASPDTIRPLVSRAKGRVWIYSQDREATRFIKRILAPWGYSLETESNHYAIVQAARDDRIDVLILDPASSEFQGFNLCGLLRSEFNMLHLPILIITEPFADHLIHQGYAAGANDFLTKPYDAGELSARVLSLIRLRQVVRHNTSLARSEEEKKTFLYFLTHDVNTPLTIIMNRVRDLERLVTLDDLEEIISDLTASTDEINAIVQNVLISFRIADGRQVIRPGRIRIDDMLHGLAEGFERKAADKNQALALNMPEDLPPAGGDWTSVRSILFNLIDNAVKFTPPGGRIEISVAHNGKVSVSVGDTGPGIPENELADLFGRFQRLSPQPTGGESSTGLGLYVARELARMNGGELEYTPGNPGALFTLRLTTAGAAEESA